MWCGFRLRATLTHAFEYLAERQLLRVSVAPEHLALATASLMDGLQLQWLNDPTAFDMAEELRTYLRMVTRLDL